MQYALLIYGDEATAESASVAAKDAIMRDFGAFTASILKSGHLRGGDAFHPTTTATTVRVRNEHVAVTDGPFALTREQLAGFYLIDARNLDEAIEIASRVPSVRLGGAVEIRPVLSVPRPGEATTRSSSPRKSRSTRARN